MARCARFRRPFVISSSNAQEVNMRRTTLLVLCTLLLPVTASAQGWIQPLPRPTQSPPPRVERLRTSITVRVTDRVARVQVEEWFRNSGAGLAEGDYIYPLAGEAVFSDFSLFQGEEELKGETMDATRARAIYEDIVRRQKDPALIELAGHGLVRARVFPIAAGETRNITLRYTQVLGRAGDAYRFRHLAGTARLRDAGISRPAVSGPDDTPITFTLISDAGSRFAEPFSPTHRLRVSREGERLTVRPEGAVRGSVDVFLPLARPTAGLSLATHRVDSEDGYFMLTVSPGRAQGPPAPRDIAVVVDVSGSMSGEKMEQARQALHRLLGTLRESDRFRLVAFSNRVEAQRPEWTTATRAAVVEARGWVDRLSATGGTNVAGALDEAFRTPGADGRLHLVIVITDGLPTVGETNPDRIAARVEATRRDARIFTFGVGYDLQTYLLERIAVAGRGTVDYVEPGADVEEAVGSLAAKISHPVLVDLALDGSPVRLKDLQPARLPDLYAGDDLVLLGRYEAARAGATGELSIAGTRGDRRERVAASVEFPAHAAASDYIPGLWAARKVGELMRTIRVEGSTPERIAEVRALALRYGLLTEYTSYLVLEPGVNAVANGVGRAGTLSAPAAPPIAVSGETAVQSARLAAVRREAQTVADLAAAEQTAVQQTRRQGADERLIAGRRFRADASSWIDTEYRPGGRVVHLLPFSRAYFDVAARLPELSSYLSAFESVIVAGHRVSIRVAPSGASTLTAAELEQLVLDFRGAAAR
jgi:Ca-activated chloride channel family protein